MNFKYHSQCVLPIDQVEQIEIIIIRYLQLDSFLLIDLNKECGIPDNHKQYKLIQHILIANGAGETHFKISAKGKNGRTFKYYKK